MDHIIMSALWGAEKAILEYPQVKAGIILMMDRELSVKQNEIIVSKAIKYKSQGIIGIDVAGPNRKTFSIQEHKFLFDRARKAGLGITIHTGEELQLDEMRYVVNEIKPDRIGHGIQCVHDKELMKAVIKNKIVLEICPTSNLRNNVMKDIKELKSAIRTLIKNKIKFTINTDGPEMYQTSISKEHEFLLKNKIMTQKELDNCTKIALAATFIK